MRRRRQRRDGQSEPRLRRILEWSPMTNKILVDAVLALFERWAE
jgi:hypothetical protein